MSSAIEVEIRKSPVPLVWLDTWVYRKLADLRSGSFQDPITAQRLLEIQRLVELKTRGKKLICVAGDQGEELTDGRVRAAEARAALSALTCGVRMHHGMIIELTQFTQFAAAYLRQQQAVTLAVDDAFPDNPVQEAARNLAAPFRVTAHVQPTDAQLDEWLAGKRRSAADLEKLRRRNLNQGVVFAAQIAHEYEGEIEARDILMQRIREQRASPNVLFIWQLRVEGWRQAGGDVTDFSAILRFFASAHYRAIPSVSITARMYADLLTGNAEVNDGDANDVRHVATALPYCDIMLCDQRTRHRIERLGLDREYRTRVYCLRDYEQIRNDLSSL